jgi:DNA-binding transcriptional LysR family regulator
MRNRQTLDEVFKSADVTPNVVLETNSMRVLLAESLSGRAFSVMPLSALPTQHDGAGLRVHPITPKYAQDVCLARLRRETQPALSHAAWLDLEVILNQSLKRRI